MHFPLILSAAFLAGFVDSIAGGGGMVQIPALLFLFPSYPLPSLLGTNKLASAFGTMMASFHYVRALHISLKRIIPTMVLAFVGATIGASAVVHLNPAIAKPIIMVLLVLIGIYLVFRKQLGLKDSQADLTSTKLQLFSMAIGLVMGCYDGFLGPGTGSILIFFYVSVLGFSFLRASAYSKLINLTTNLAALLYFALHGQVIYKLAFPMMACNIAGNYCGAKLAIKRGSGFVRVVFFIILMLLVIKLIYDSFLLK